MNKIFEKPIAVVSLLIVLGAYLFIFQSGSMALTDPDEVFYGQTAKEMLNRGEWITPYLYGAPQFEKPILFYWLVEASFKIFGVNEFAARFPSALFGILGLIAIYLLGSILFNRRVGLFSAIVLATSLEYLILSRACVTDMALGTLMLIGVLFFFYGYLKEKRYFYYLSAASFALAVLTKGPIAVILPVAVFVIYLLLAKDIKAFKKIPVFASLAVFILVASPWYILMCKLHGSSFLNAFFGFQNITRFLHSEHEIGSQAYYNIPVVFAGLFPWSVFLPLGFWRSLKKAFGRQGTTSAEKNHSIFILTWFSVIFIFFSISRTKLPTYIFPSFISLALMIALYWDDFIKEPSRVRGMGFSFYLLLASAVSGAIAASVFIKYDYPTILPETIIAGVVILCGIISSVFAYINKRFILSFFLVVCSVAAFLYPLSELILPKIEHYETSKDISGKLLELMKPGERLGSESHYLPGLAFYTGKFPLNLDSHSALLDFIDSPERVWFVLKEKNHRQLYELPDSRYPKPSYMVYKLDKKVIITNSEPVDGKYILRREKKR